MDNDSTGNGGPLSLAERAKQGLPLRLGDIAELEYPGNPRGKEAENWIRRMEVACKYGSLRLKPGDVFDEFGGWPYIPRENYRAWRVTQRDLTTDSIIHLWLGATPPAESILSVEHSLPEKPASGGIALIEAENAALAALRQELRREPDFDEFWDYLTTKDETGTVADFTDDRLDWIGHSGKSCSTAKSTIRNRLTAAKKRNPFTPS